MFATFITKILAAYNYEKYVKSGNESYCLKAEKLAYNVGKMEKGEVCPRLFKGKTELERHWACGKGHKFFTQWVSSRIDRNSSPIGC